MDHQKAKDFIETLIKAWELGQHQKVGQFYSATLQGTLNQTQAFGFKEIEHRMQYIATHYEKPKYQLLDLVASNNKIAIHMIYSSFDKKLNQTINCLISSFYLLNV